MSWDNANSNAYGSNLNITDMPMLDMMDEHQGANRRKSPGPNEQTYTPSTEEREQVTKLEALFQKAKKRKSKYDYAWPYYYKLFRGKHWKTQRPTYRQTEVFNLCFQTLQSQIPIITDVRPKFEFLPQEPQDRDFADLMNDIAAADWIKNNWQMVLNEVIYDSHLYGTGISCLKYNEEKNAITYYCDDVFYIFPDPYGRSLKDKCNYLCTAIPEDVARVKRKYPEKAPYIKADVTNFISPDRIDLSETKYRSPVSDQVIVEVTGYQDLTGMNEVMVKTMYIYDDDMVEEEAQENVDSETGVSSTVYVKKLKYPNGRKVVFANNMILEDGPLEFDDGKIPYQTMQNYILPHQFWGISELEPLEGPQQVFNKLVSYALDVLFLMGNPIWIVDTTSGIDTQNLTNQPGLIVEKEPGSEVHRDMGVQLQPYVLNLIERLKEWFEQLAGSQDVTRGTSPSGITAAAAIENLQDAAQTRIRQKIRNLDAYLQDLGQAYVSRVMQFYTSPRVFRITMKDNTEKYFRMHIDHRPFDPTHPQFEADQPDKTRPIAVVHKFTQNGQLEPTVNEYELRGELDVRVSTGSTLPFQKADTERRAFSLFDRGIIDAEEVLKSLDYPNWEAILQRMQEKQAQMAQMQQQQQMANTKKPAAA